MPTFHPRKISNSEFGLCNFRRYCKIWSYKIQIFHLFAHWQNKYKCYSHSLVKDGPIFFCRRYWFMRPFMVLMLKQLGRIFSWFIFGIVFESMIFVTFSVRVSFLIVPLSSAILSSQSKTCFLISLIFCWYRTLSRSMV